MFCSVNELILKYRGKQDEKKIKTEQQACPGPVDLLDIITEDTLDLANVNHLLEVLANKKQQLEAVCAILELAFITDF